MRGVDIRSENDDRRYLGMSVRSKSDQEHHARYLSKIDWLNKRKRGNGARPRPRLHRMGALAGVCQQTSSDSSKTLRFHIVVLVSLEILALPVDEDHKIPNQREYEADNGLGIKV